MTDAVSLPQVRLYTKGRIMGHKRGKSVSTPHTTLVKLEGVTDQKEAQFYLGKVSAVETRDMASRAGRARRGRAQSGSVER
jgi:large subunit ribosomal protein L35Ae